MELADLWFSLPINITEREVRSVSHQESYDVETYNLHTWETEAGMSEASLGYKARSCLQQRETERERQREKGGR